MKAGYTPWNAELAAHMRRRQVQNLHQAKASSAEEWMAQKLKNYRGPGRWTRQAQSKYRIFDFWNHRLGVAIEVDGPEHDGGKDARSDWAQMATRGIVVLRVRNFNEEDAAEALRAVTMCESWNQRRASLGLPPIANAG